MCPKVVIGTSELCITVSSALKVVVTHYVVGLPGQK